MTGYTAHTPKLATPRDAAEVERESLFKALYLARLAKLLVEHPHYSGV